MNGFRGEGEAINKGLIKIIGGINVRERMISAG